MMLKRLFVEAVLFFLLIIMLALVFLLMAAILNAEVPYAYLCP